MNERILNLLSMCLQAKEKGHDVFFCYSPHVQSVNISSFENGWTSKGEDEPNPPTVKFSFYLDKDWSLAEFDKAEAYLKELLA